ncbi:MAG: hypothetical protein HY776_04595 [Actinobacteria bacterium]|nr:hypothetical protein [Actinomycetota bacterium]
MRRILVLLMIAALTIVTVTDVAIAAKGKALGKKKFELEGSIAAVSAENFSVKVKSSSKPVKEFKGKEIVLKFNEQTKFVKKGQPATKADLANGLRVHVKGIIVQENQTSPKSYVASTVNIKPSEKISAEDKKPEDTGTKDKEPKNKGKGRKK